MNNKDSCPAIRVFISSTFIDMQNERNYFNRILMPKLSSICARRGISFFSVDLRWGITEEEQINGMVLPLCLREIDRCRPFFIGMLGERYGTIANHFTEKQYEMIPWLKEQKQLGITELEMLYGVLDTQKNERISNCLFLMRDKKLSDEFYPENIESPDKTAALANLKKRIREEMPDETFSYASLEEFGDLIISNFQKWIDRDYPDENDVNTARQRWYRNEMLRDYLPHKEMENFLDYYFETSDKPLMIVDKKMSGKTALLNNWTPASGKKIVINCVSDEKFAYWPSCAAEIVRQIRSVCGIDSYPKFDAYASLGVKMMDNLRNDGFEEIFYVTDEDKENFRVGFVKWLSELKVSEKIYIILNDLNVLEDTQSKFMSWLPVILPENIYIAATTNDMAMVGFTERTGWNKAKMLPFSAEMIETVFRNRLSVFGKSMSRAQLDTFMKCPVIGDAGRIHQLIFFMLSNADFQSIDKIAADISVIESTVDFEEYLYNYTAEVLTPLQGQLFKTIMLVLYCSSVPLTEQECSEICGRTLEFTPLDWSAVRAYLGIFSITNHDMWSLNDNDAGIVCKRNFPESQIRNIHHHIADMFISKLEGVKDIYKVSTKIIRNSTKYAKASLYHISMAEEWELLAEKLCSPEILRWLCNVDTQHLRSGWIKVLSHIDCGISDMLFETIEKIKNTPDRFQKDMLRAVASLFHDLQIQTDENKIREKTGGIPAISAFAMDSSKFSEEFNSAYDKAAHYQDSGHLRELFNLLTGLLSKPDWAPAERMHFQSMMAYCASRLNLENASDENYKAYNEILRNGDFFELATHVANYCQYYYNNERYSEAYKNAVTARKYALELGHMRTYLMCSNFMGMCLYRFRKYSDSIECLTTTMNIWKRVNYPLEAAVAGLNLSNAYYISGDPEKAIEILKDMRQLIDYEPTSRVEMHRKT